ncbi:MULTISPECIES: hypothetical protein [Nocardia]|uniref:hypothetical protein n=1 Tax=Nocardia TaxID=1817 RepID=UPI0007EA4F3F|nr:MULTISPECIES: hypothetical protein [Nocardia]MBF6272899.1 hypothetical protein [Nocardia nova]OBA52982.1 hypothetical protein A5789_02485 [Nocardia sp. 852002-51101_SCH5132738]OBB49115.1 hypothetical protein A5748_20250 [Nocardia sp. 852002-51244_SCH5132740]OBF66625.1 hypothetical protein A9X06_05955 [Mycobacterium sp. 852002-51759_SCH5129042]
MYVLRLSGSWIKIGRTSDLTARLATHERDYWQHHGMRVLDWWHSRDLMAEAARRAEGDCHRWAAGQCARAAMPPMIYPQRLSLRYRSGAVLRSDTETFLGPEYELTCGVAEEITSRAHRGEPILLHWWPGMNPLELP